MMMQPRQNALWLDGGAHTRLRSAITDSLEWVDTHALAASVARIADDLLTRLVTQERPDLVADFADALPMQVLIDMFGCPLDLGHAIVGAIAKLFDTTQDAAQANADLEAACLALTRLKRDHPGYDVTSWLVAHPARLTDEEMIQQILLVIGAGTTPCTNLIANALLLLITDDRFSGDVHTGVRPVSHALDQVLWEDPPISNYCPLYLREEHIYEGIRLLPGVPILVSFAAANSDPALAAGADRRAGNRAHLAFSAGIRACPAPDLARVISETAIERVLDRLPDLALNCSPSQLMRRPGTFHSGWTHLPVTFPVPPRPALTPPEDHDDHPTTPAWLPVRDRPDGLGHPPRSPPTARARARHPGRTSRRRPRLVGHGREADRATAPGRTGFQGRPPALARLHQPGDPREVAAASVGPGPQRLDRLRP